MADKDRLLKIALSAALFTAVFLRAAGACAAEEDNGKPVYLRPAAVVASSFDDSEWAPEPNPVAAADGDFNTRWSSEMGKDNEWIYFDFGKQKTFTEVMIYWERAYATEFELQSSDDAMQWKKIAEVKGSKGDKESVLIPKTTAQYLRLVGLKRFNPDWGFSVWEMEAYGPDRLNPGDLSVEQVFPGRKPREEVVLVMEDPVASPGAIAKGEFQKGVNYSSYNEVDLAMKESDAMLEYLKTMNVAHVCIIVTWYQDTLESMTMAPDPQGGRTPRDEALSHAINKAHSLGLKVMLKPHIDIQSGEFRGDIPGEEEWFRNYGEFILKYAKFAAKFNVELFCVGTELSGTPTKWEPNWRKIIKDVRGVYKGPITYAANWDEYKYVPFWNDLDFVGIDAYFPLTNKNDPAKEELVQAWKREAKQIEEFLKKKGINKPVIFTEAGYASADGANKRPWEVTSKTEDQREQADCLDALMAVMSNRVWFSGLYVWNVFPQEVSSPLGFPIKGKLAEKVLAGWYSKAK
jgi:hypothetical protein